MRTKKTVKKKYKVLIEGIYRTWVEVEAESAFDALMSENINIPKDIQVNINDIEYFIPIEVEDINNQKENDNESK